MDTQRNQPPDPTGIGLARFQGHQTHLYLLDQFSLQRDGVQLCLPEGARRLVALLALQQAVLPRDYVAGVLWPEVSEPQAHHSLRTAVWRLHKLVPSLLTSSAAELGLTAAVTVDVRELAGHAHRLLSRPHEPDDADLRWPCIGGELLPGWYDDWVLLERERIRQLHLHALQTATEVLSARGRFGEALETALHAVQVDPLRESAHRLVMHVHLAEGNVHEVLRQYEFCRLLLWRELQVRPSRRMRELLRAAAAQPPGRDGDRPGWPLLTSRPLPEACAPRRRASGDGLVTPAGHA